MAYFAIFSTFTFKRGQVLFFCLNMNQNSTNPTPRSKSKNMGVSGMPKSLSDYLNRKQEQRSLNDYIFPNGGKK